MDQQLRDGDPIAVGQQTGQPAFDAVREPQLSFLRQLVDQNTGPDLRDALEPHAGIHRHRLAALDVGHAGRAEPRAPCVEDVCSRAGRDAAATHDQGVQNRLQLGPGGTCRRSVRWQERVRVVAVNDRVHVQPRVRDRRGEWAQRHKGRDAPDRIARQRLAQLLAAEVGVAEVIDGREEERDGERERADCELAAASLEHLLSFKCGEDGDDRERGEDHTVRESVDNAAPGDRGGELQPVRVPGRRLALDDPGHHRDECESDDDAAAPVVRQQFARRGDPKAEPRADEPEHRGDVDGVVEVAVDRGQVCQQKRDRETECEPGGEPEPLTLARRSRGRMSMRGPAVAAGCDDIHGCLLSCRAIPDDPLGPIRGDSESAVANYACPRKLVVRAAASGRSGTIEPDMLEHGRRQMSSPPDGAVPLRVIPQHVRGKSAIQLQRQARWRQNPAD